jgi:hypothetical protein
MAAQTHLLPHSLQESELDASHQASSFLKEEYYPPGTEFASLFETVEEGEEQVLLESTGGWGV